MKIDTVLVLGIFCIFYVKSVNENLHYPTARVRIFLVKNQRSNAALRIISSAKKSFLFHLSLFTCQAKQDIFPSLLVQTSNFRDTYRSFTMVIKYIHFTPSSQYKRNEVSLLFITITKYKYGPSTSFTKGMFYFSYR
jgi:hypothetical protein